MLPLLEAQDFRRFALLSNNTPFAQGFRRPYAELLPSIGGKIVADEVVTAGAKLDDNPCIGLTTYGHLTGTQEQMREFFRELRTPCLKPPDDSGGVANQTARIAAASPDAVIVLPHTVEDAWFLLSELREAGFSGPGGRQRCG